MSDALQRAINTRATPVATIAQPAAAVTPVVAQPAVAAVAQQPVAQPAAAPVTAHSLAATPGPIVAQPAVAQPAANLNGGGRFAGVMAALAVASPGSNRQNVPSGTATFLLKEGSYKVTETKGAKLSSFKMLCLIGGTDINMMTHGTQGYIGAVPGEIYDVPFFIDMTGVKQKMTVDNLTAALECCMGWAKDHSTLKQYQSTPDGLAKLTELIKGMFCVDIVTEQGTGQVSMFSNQVVVQLTAKPSAPKQKKVNNVPVFDSEGKPVMTSWDNVYWDKRVPLAEIQAALGDEGVIKAFESAENWAAAIAMEQQLAAV